MLDFTYACGTKYVFGMDKESLVGKEIASLNKKKVLIHYGSAFAQESGLLDRVKCYLKESEIDFVCLGGVVPNPKDKLVYEGIAMVREQACDFVLAVGGGSVIDSAKAIACGAVYDGDFWDLTSTKATVEDSIMTGSILTIPAAGSESSTVSVITREEGKLKKRIRSEIIRPKFAILDPKLAMTLPDYQVACGACDIMVHVMERYFTNTVEVDLSDRMLEAVLCTIVKVVPKILLDRNDYDSMANMMWAGTLAHNGLFGMGRQEDWSSHDIEHELSALYDVAHGAGLAVVVPAWMKHVVSHNPLRFAQFAVRVFGCDMDFENPMNTAVEGIKRFEKFLKSIGLPANFAELGAKREDIPHLVEKVHRNNGQFSGYFVPLSDDDIFEIYEACCIS